MTARRRDLERELGVLLAAHVGEIDHVGPARIGAHLFGARQLVRAREPARHLGQRGGGVDRHVGQRCRFRGALARQHHRSYLARAGEARHRQASGHAAQRAVERQLAEEQHPIERAHRDDLLRGEDPDGDREIERGAVLAHVGGREVDRHLARGQLPAGVGDRRAHAHAALLDRARAQPDEVVAGQAERDIDLGADRVRLDAEESGRMNLREHAPGKSTFRAAPPKRPRRPEISSLRNRISKDPVRAPDGLAKVGTDSTFAVSLDLRA